MTHSVAEIYWRFGGTCYHKLQGVGPEDGVSEFNRNVSKPRYISSQCRRLLIYWFAARRNTDVFVLFFWGGSFIWVSNYVCIYRLSIKFVSVTIQVTIDLSLGRQLWIFVAVELLKLFSNFTLGMKLIVLSYILVHSLSDVSCKKMLSSTNLGVCGYYVFWSEPLVWYFNLNFVY